MREIRASVGAYAAGFDAALVTAADAQRIVADTVAAENMLATIKAMAARRVAETELWRKEGDASAAHQLARTSGTSVGKAREALETAGRLGGLPALETAGRLGGLPALEAAARRGEVSPAQAAPIADAASKAPGSERRLLTTAKQASLGELLDACARTKAAAQPDDEARQRAIHASKILRRRRTADGAGELLYRSTLEEVAEMYAIAQGRADRRFRTARAEGRHEPGEAYLADCLLDAVRASQCSGAGGSGPEGGSATDGSAAGGSAAYQQTGLDWRSPECTTLGCNAKVRLDNDHRVPWAESKVTLLHGMDPGCGGCHDRKRYKGWAWVEGTGKRPMVPPDDPRRPKNRNQGPAPPGEAEVA